METVHKIHMFYCDKCGKFIGNTIEEESCEKLGDCKTYFDSTTYSSTLCSECSLKFYSAKSRTEAPVDIKRLLREYKFIKDLK